MTKPIDLLRETPLFSKAKEKHLAKLAELFIPIHFSKNEILVAEHQNMDSTFLILSGEVEISVTTMDKKKEQNTILATLQAGEFLGLEESGFYSKTGTRTANAIALSDVSALKLNLADLRQFLKEEPSFMPALKEAADNVAKHHFIKQISPFSKIPPKTLQELSKHTKELSVEAGHVFFRQGDVGDNCYFLISGEAEVWFRNKAGDEELITTLKNNDFFGELGLTIDSARNATIISKTKSRVLLIDRQSFQKLLAESSKINLDNITKMIMDRLRPEQCSDVEIHENINAEQQKIYILKNNRQKTYFKLSDQSLFVWNLLNGDNNIQEIARDFFLKYGVLALDEIGRLVLALMNEGFVKMPKFASYIETPKQSIGMAFLTNIRKYLTYEYSINNVDQAVNRLYQGVGYLFFTKLALYSMALLAILGFFAFLLFGNQVSTIIRETSNAWIMLPFIVATGIIIVPFHELAHALSTKHYGFQVHRVGIGWFWLNPIAFVDTSDMWLGSKKQRIVVNLSGIYINIVISGLLSLIALLIPNQTAAVFLWLIAFYSYLLGFYNLDPMFELDGYYALMDATAKPNLRQAAIIWLLEDTGKTIRSFALVKKNFPQILYWLLTILFISIASWLAYFLQNFVVTHMLSHSSQVQSEGSYGWVLSTLVVLMSFLSLYGMVKQQSKQQYGQKQ